MARLATLKKAVRNFFRKLKVNGNPISNKIHKMLAISRIRRTISIDFDVWPRQINEYRRAIQTLYNSLNKNRLRFLRVLEDVISRTYVSGTETPMIIALTDVWQETLEKGKKLPDIFLECYYTQWHKNKIHNLFNACTVEYISYKPFWEWMFKYGTYVHFDSYELMEEMYYHRYFDSSTPFYKFMERVAATSKTKSEFFSKKYNVAFNGFWKVLGGACMPGFNIDEFFKSVENYAPEYIDKALEKMYKAAIEDLKENDYEEKAKNFACLLERIADYEYMHDDETFVGGVSYSLAESINIDKDVEKIVECFWNTEIFMDIVWILENRFGVDEEKIDEIIMCIASETYCKVNPFDICTMGDEITKLFCFPIAYEMFFICNDMPNNLQYELEALGQ